MNAIDAIILGVIQGLTEFLPISSSGHLVIGETLLGMNTPGVSLEIWLHLGTLLAVLGYFHRRILAVLKAIYTTKDDATGANRRVLLALIIGTIPAVIVGLLLKPLIETAFDSPVLAASMLLVTAAILLLTPLARSKQNPIGPARGWWIGLAQAAAIMPGISRSGSTIACAMFLGINPAVAAEFSFLLAIPAIGGAFLLDLLSSGENFFASGQFSMYLLGMGVSFIFGLVSIHYLLKIIKQGKLFYFGFYCLVAGTLTLVYLN